MRYASVILLCLLCLACSRKGAEQGSPHGEVIPITPVGSNGSYMIPKATVFRMSGDYAGNVGVTLNPDGSLAYYPAPSDISETSAPLALGDGWWLNRQGLSSNSVFTRWTFAEYAALSQAPSQEEILEAIIPDAHVTEMVTLPLTMMEAAADPSRCLLYIND